MAVDLPGTVHNSGAGSVMPYKRQLLINFLTEVKDDDWVITHGSQDLHDKFCAKSPGQSRIVKAPPIGKTARGEELAEALRWLGEVPASRLYLRGHGDWMAQTLGGRGPDVVAGMVAVKPFPAMLVSVTGCQCGRDRRTGGRADVPDDKETHTAQQSRVFGSANSFASRFHYLLRHRYRIEVPVYARVYDVQVQANGEKYTVHGLDTIATGEHRRSHSKVVFVWERGVQRRYWVPYPPVVRTPGSALDDDDASGGMPVFG
jgi:hypothetical protein